MSELDLLIRGGRVLDGAGNPWCREDVGIRGDRIVAVGHDLGTAKRTLDVDDLIVSPGFIDIHTHSDLQILATPLHEPKVRQGGFSAKRRPTRHWGEPAALGKKL